MSVLVGTFIDNLNYALRNSSEKLADDTEKLFWLNKTLRQLTRVLISIDSDWVEAETAQQLTDATNSSSFPTRCHSIVDPIRIVAGEDWATATAYVVGDYVVYGAVTYICAVAHTSNVWATDLAAGDWSVTHPVDYVVKKSLPWIRDRRAELGTADGQPYNYAVRGTTIEFDYTADQDYIIQINYLERLADRIIGAAWVTVTAYVVGDYVTTGGVGYICLINHTSGTFATDLAAGKWSIDTALSMPYNDEFNDVLEQAAAIFIKNTNDWDTSVDGAVYNFLWKAAQVDLVKRLHVPRRTRLDF